MSGEEKVWVVFIHPDPTASILKELEEYANGKRSIDDDDEDDDEE